MANKNDNKSMFLYTALIFIVAVLLIIFSFLGQTNMQKNQPQVSESPDKEMSISEKASILSEENTVLLENNSNLKKENQELSEENIQLKSDNESLTQKQSQNDLLLSANGYFKLGNNSMALETLDKVNYNDLSSDQKIIYDNIKNNIN